jgi:hypothetical protein
LAQAERKQRRVDLVDPFRYRFEFVSDAPLLQHSDLVRERLSLLLTARTAAEVASHLTEAEQ